MSFINNIAAEKSLTNEAIQKTSSVKGKLQVADYGSTDINEPQDVQVDFSQISQEVLNVKDMLESIPDNRDDKIKEIQELINNGEYEFDLDKTAENILMTFLNMTI